MVTGSHIPDDRNGIKFNRPDGEILKQDEAGMRRQRIEFDEILLDEDWFAESKPLQACPGIGLDNTTASRFYNQYL